MLSKKQSAFDHKALAANMPKRPATGGVVNAAEGTVRKAGILIVPCHNWAGS